MNLAQYSVILIVRVKPNLELANNIRISLVMRSLGFSKHFNYRELRRFVELI